MKVVLSNGGFAEVDFDDLGRVLAHTWSRCSPKRSKTSYAITRVDGRTVYMHRFVLDPPLGVEVDHVNGDGLDNRRANLRPATRSQNMRAIRKGLSRGVTQSRSGRFTAAIYQDNRKFHLGTYDTYEEASAAYKKASAERFREELVQAGKDHGSKENGEGSKQTYLEAGLHPEHHRRGQR